MAQKKKAVSKSKPKLNKPKVKPKAKPAKALKAKVTVKATAKPKPKAKPQAAKKLTPKGVAKSASKKAPALRVVATKSAKALSHFQPLDDRILVEKMGESDRTPGGLFIPDTAKERPMKGRVVAVGRGHLNKKGRIRPLDVKVGDVVLFAKWSGGEVDFAAAASASENDFVIMRESDLLGVVSDS